MIISLFCAKILVEKAGDTYMTNIGKNILNRRKELNLTQEELAIRMGYKSKSTINKIETGINDIPQSKIVKFAEVLQTTPADLMGWKEKIEEAPVKMAERHIEIIMDEDISDIFDDFKKLDSKQKKMIKNLIHEMADVEA